MTTKKYLCTHSTVAYIGVFASFLVESYVIWRLSGKVGISSKNDDVTVEKQKKKQFFNKKSPFYCPLVVQDFSPTFVKNVSLWITYNFIPTNTFNQKNKNHSRNNYGSNPSSDVNNYLF